MTKWFDYYIDQLRGLIDIALTVILGIGIVASFIYGLFILVSSNT